MIILKPSRFLFILVWVCLWKEGVSELPSNLQNNGPPIDTEQVKESIIVGIPVPVEKAPTNSNVFFVVRNPAQFPGAVERLVERIQTYFSSYNSIESLTEREKPHGAVNKNSSVTGQQSNSPAQSSLVASTDPSPVNSAKQVEINPSLNGAPGDPDDISEPVSVYEITIGPDIVHEPSESVVPNQAPFVPPSYLPPIEESQSVNEIAGGSNAPGNPPPAVTLLPPFEEPQKVPEVVEPNEIEPPCTISPKPSPIPVTYLPPEISESSSNELYETSTVKATTYTTTLSTTSIEPASLEYIPPDNTHVEGPYTYELPSTTTLAPPTTQKVPYVYEQLSTVATPTQCIHSTLTTTSTTEKIPCKHATSTTTPKPTTTTTTTTPKPITQPPCQTSPKPTKTTTTSTTTKPTTQPPCHATTPKPTAKPPCHRNTTPKSTEAPYGQERPTEPSWSYLPPTPTPHHHHHVPASYYPAPEHVDYDHRPESFNLHVSFRPFFRHKSKFLYPLKRLLGLA